MSKSERARYDEDARFRDQVGLLIRALRSDMESVQEIAVVQLSQFGPKAIPCLTSALSHAFDEASRTRKDVLDRPIDRSNPEGAISGISKVLGIISDPATVSDIVKALPRPEAVEALAKIGNKEALEAVIECLPKWFGTYVDLVGGAEEGREGYRKFGISGRRWEPVDDFVRKIFGYFGEEGGKRLQAALREGNKETKDTVAKILATLGDSNSRQALLEALERGDISSKAEIAQALHQLKAKEAVPRMVTELFKTQDYIHSNPRRTATKEDEYWRDARDALAKAVVELGSLDDWISVYFHRPKIEMRAPYFYSAIINSGEKAVPELTKLLQAPNPLDQKDAAEMIAKIKRGEKSEASLY